MEPTTKVPSPFITQVSVEDLFGSLSYRIPDTPNSLFDRLLILYGDNGAGKTTLLRLVFSTLFQWPTGGNKGFVARTPFKRFRIAFSNGTVVEVSRTDKLTGNFTVEISDDEGRQAFHVEVNDEGRVAGAQGGLYSKLQHLNLPIFLLPDDRQVRSTEPNYSAVPHERVIKRDDAYILFTDEKGVVHREKRHDSHHLQVEPVLGALSTWMRRHVLRGSTAGEESAASIYLKIVQQLGQIGTAVDESGKSSQAELINRIFAITQRTKEFSRYGITPPFLHEKFIDAIQNVPNHSQQALARILEPYLSGTEARLDALNSIRDLIDNYVQTANSFLRGKELTYTIQAGVEFKSASGEIKPEWLSSGERQLILLLSHAILARDLGGIFLIDEPELSLNIKWQRRLIDALLQCTEGSSIQFVLASHSIELISQYIRNAIQLKPL